MTRTLKTISWILIALGCGRIVLSRFVGPMRVFPEIHLQLMIPYAFLAAAVVLLRSERMAGWSVGVCALLALVTFVTVYQAPREFWRYLSLWIDYICIGQSVVAVVFLFESFRQFLKERRSRTYVA